MSKRKSDYQNPAQKEEEETIKKMKIQKRPFNLSEMPFIALRRIFKNIHLQSALKMMRANKPWNAFIRRYRAFWKKISMGIEVTFDTLSDGRVAFAIVLTPASAKPQYNITIEEAESGTPITPDEDIYIQQELKANVADPMGQFLKLMKTVVEVVNITRLALQKMPDEAIIGLAAIFDKKTIIQRVFKNDKSRCPSTLRQLVRSLSGTKSITLCVPSEAITADLIKLPQVQNADRLSVINWPEYLPLGDADLLALKTGFVRFECRLDLTLRYFRTIVQEFMTFKRNFEHNESYSIYYQGIFLPEQVFDGFLYSVSDDDGMESDFKYEVKRSDNLTLVVYACVFNHCIELEYN